MFSRVAQIDSTDAVRILTATLNGFKLEAKDAINVIDAFNGVDLRAATSARDLGTALSYVASSAGQYGVSFEHLVGLIATGSEVTQRSAETMGTAWNAMLSRMGAIRAGKQFDDMGESINNVETALLNVGDASIKLRKSETEWRDFGDVLDEIAEKWNTLNDTERSYIASMISGSRNQDVFLATMSNYANVLEYTNVAANSAGTTLEKFSVIQDSLSQKTNRFTEALAQMWMKSLDTDIIKNLVDIGTWLVTGLGDLNNLVLILIGTLATLNSSKVVSFFTSMGNSIGGVTSNIQALGAVVSILPQAFSYAQANGVSLTAALELLSGGAITANVAMSALTAGVGLLFSAFSIGTIIYNNYQAEQEKIYRQALQLSSAFESEVDSLDELRGKLQDETLSREDLLTLIGNHNKAYEDELSAILDVNDARQAGINLLDEEAKARAQEVIRETGGQYARARDILEDPYSVSVMGAATITYKNRQELVDQLRESIDKLNQKQMEGIELTGAEKLQYDNLSRTYNELTSEISEATTIVSNYEDAQAILNGTYESTYDAINDVNDSLNDLDGEITKSEQLFNSLSDAITAFGEAQTKSEQDFRNSQIEEILKGLHAEAVAGTITWQEYEDALSLVSAGTTFAEYATESLKESISELDSAYSTIQSAIQEQNETGQLSAKTMLELIDLSDEYKLALFDEEGNIRNLDDAFRTLYITKLQDLQASRMLEMQSLIDQWEEESKTLEDLKIAWQQATASKIAYTEVNFGNFADSPQVKAFLEEMKLIDQQIAQAMTGSLPLGGSSGGASSSSDPWKQAADRRLRDAEYLRDREEAINGESIANNRRYFETLRQINEEYYSGRPEYLDEFRDNELNYIRLSNVNPIAQGCTA